MKRAISEREMNFSGPCFTIDDNTKSYEAAFVVDDLTFLYISFAILFCQKKVKKNCKSIVGVFLKNAGMTCSEACGRHAPFLW